MKKNCLLLLLLMGAIHRLPAQFADSLIVKIGTEITAASKDYQPFWLVSNIYGATADVQTDLSSDIFLANTHRFGRRNGFTDSAAARPPFYLRYGLDLYNNNRFKSLFLQEGYIKIGYHNLELRGGRYKEIIGEVDPDLSSGSLNISGNSIPVTKISVALTRYTTVPFTRGWLQFKGNFTHGWMGNDRYMKNAFLHEKTFYVRVGKKKLKLFGGITHFAEWGGRRGSLHLDRSLQGYLNVVLVKEADDGSVGAGFLPNRPGDHRGSLELGLDWENENILLHGYNQTPFESGLNIDIRNIDRLLGLSITNKKKGAKLVKVVAEFIHTRQMNDFYPLSERESYYNNGAYKTGWEYENRIVGTPLFVNRVRGSHYFPSVIPYNWDQADSSILGNTNILLNRVVGGHIGFIYKLSPKLSMRTMLTFTRYIGGPENPEPIATPESQFYSLEEITYNLNGTGFSFKAAAALDWGKLTNNSGIKLGCAWAIRGVRKRQS